MPAGPGERLDRFATAIGERATLVADHAAIDGPAEAEPVEPAFGAHYDG